jgi:hypothetical protein
MHGHLKQARPVSLQGWGQVFAGAWSPSGKPAGRNRPKPAKNAGQDAPLVAGDKKLRLIFQRNKVIPKVGPLFAW